MPNALDIGPFLIQTEWIAAGAALLIAYIIIFYIFFQEEKNHYSPVLSNGFILFLLTYQGSTLLFHPSAALTDPLAMLSFPADWKGWLLSWLILLVFLYYSAEKRSLSYGKLLRLSIALYTLSFFLFGFLLRFTGFELSIAYLLYMFLHLIGFWGMVPKVQIRVLCIVLLLFSLGAGILNELFTMRTFFVYLPAWPFYITAAACLTGAAVTFFTKEADRSHGS
ncbi:hypothetical protein D7Z54_29260 [Salibacterium salarium]|uniref:Uncharacterized protein n=1 Tax=Salibacterium salarium TaxID=284579 RepID=A0A3R9PYJ4_9BACI|nr:hypothetical protein [Salibacterium salarium]RSL29838.1 hypothetical protein D7Z54_29260 [Salibacterium salarium]